MPRHPYPRDRFDDLPATSGRVGAHRAENPRMRAGVVLLWAIAATVVLVVVGIFGSLIVSGRVVLFPTPSATPTPAPVVTPVLDTSYTVLVLNATTEQGLATRTKDALVAKGWAEGNVSASSAASTDFATTTVYYAVPEAEAAALGLAQLVNAADVQYDPEYPLPGTSAMQLTVVLGADQLGTVATPTP